MGNLQSNPSSSTQTTEKKYEVFLNFRGVDTRHGFTNYLYEALLRKSIETFRDEERIPKGNEIGPTLLKAIRESKVSVVIFSKEYASSKWCLRELVEIMECKEKNGQTVIPVFYKVDVHHVRRQEGSFKDGFDQLVKTFEENLEKEQIDSADVEKHKKEFYEEMQKWRQALEVASRLKGWHVEGPESKVIDEIVKDIWKKLTKAYKLSPCDFKGLFGFEERFKQVMSLLCLDNTDTRIIGIWGMGGIGKTTIADAIFHQISYDKYGKCFIQNVRQRLEQCGGLVSLLQQEVLSKVFDGQNMRLDGATLSEHIKRRLSQKKVFIVLDDVDDFLKLQELAGGLDGLGSGSRIIITTRRRDILKMCEVNDDYIYEVKGLSKQEAHQMFCQYAFGHSPPVEDLMSLLDETLQAINGNPLGLKVAGSSLLGLNKVEWQSALSGIKKSPEILEVLQISYNGLALEHRDTFLDIACFFVGEHEDYVAKILDNCPYSLKVLSDRSLITISNDKIIQMHDLLQEMGMKIVCKEDLNNPSNRSRLWTQEDVLDTLKNDDGTDAIRGIFLDMSKMDKEHLSFEVFKKMKNLRFLKFYDSTFLKFLHHEYKPYSSNVLFPNDISYLSNKLRSLNWLGCPLKALPSNFIPRELVALDLRYSNNEKLWEDKMRAPKLKWIILKYCPYLTKVLDLLEAPRLEKIDIEFCDCLLNIEIYQSLPSHRSCNHFPALEYLRLSHCYKLTQISNLLDARLLEKIDIEFCTNLRGFPSLAHHFDNLREFYVRNCNNLQSFPNCSFPSLVSLDLSGCINLQSFPNNIPFPSLVSLTLSGCIKLAKISDVLNAPLLKKINLHGCKSLLDFPRPAQHFDNLCNLDLQYCENLLRFPSNNLHFPSLICLDFRNCIKLTEFPLISGNIKKLYMRKTAIHQVPSTIENLPKLVKLVLVDCIRLNHISRSIGKLKALRKLDLSNCSALEYFPEISDTMGSLKNLDLSGTAIKGLHHSIENLIGLQMLCLSKCENLDDVPSSIEKLTELVELNLAGCTSLKHISFNICKLKALTKLNFSHSALECFPEISDTMGSLKNLDLSGIAIKGLHHSIENLSGLQMLCLSECENLDDIPSSIENLTELVKLNLAGCTSLKHISFNICKLKALTELNFSHSALECFPEISDTMGSLKNLDLSGTAIKGLHHSIENLSGLRMLCLRLCKNLEMLPNSIYNLQSLVILDLSYCSKLENLPGNSVTDLSKCGESSTTKPPICRLIKCDIDFTNCLNLNKTAVINIMELLINQHRDMTTKGYETQAVDLQFFYPGSELPGWFKHQTDGSSINIQMSGRDGVNGYLIGLAAYAIIEFHDDEGGDGDDDDDDDDDGHDDEGHGDESYDDESYGDEGSVENLINAISCSCYRHCEHLGLLIGYKNFTVIPYEDVNSDHVALWYSNEASVLELCGECTNYIFKFYIAVGSANFTVKYCGVCPIYEKHNITLPNIANETCGAVGQDFGESSVKERGQIRKFSDEAETSGRSIEDVIEPDPKRNCSYSNPNSL